MAGRIWGMVAPVAVGLVRDHAAVGMENGAGSVVVGLGELCVV